MEVTLNDDQEFFRDTTMRFLATECPISEVRSLEKNDVGFDPAYWRRGAELGWTSLLVSEDRGGGSISGSGAVDLSIVADAFGRNVAPGPLLTTNVVAGALSRGGTDEQCDTVLSGILSGDVVATWCGSEHALGNRRTDGPKATPTVGGGFVLSGSTAPVEAGAQSQHLLVTAQTPDGLAQFLVPATADGVTVTPLRSIDLVRRFARIDFADVEVGPADLVGTTDSAAADVERQLQLGLVVQSAEMVGAAERTFDFTLEWAFDRYSFGRPLASYQELKHRFADMKMWLEASHGLAAALAREAWEGASSAVETASAAKAYIGEYLAELMQDCVQMHGGIGLTSDHDLHLYLRRVTQDRSLLGVPAQHRQRIAELSAAVA